MAKYTTTIKTLIKNGFDLGLHDYPIFNESHREDLNKKIINHYYEQEIGFETAELFKFYLNSKMSEIMPYYNELYKAQENAIINVFDNVNLYEDSKRKNINEINTNSNSDSNTKNLFQDTPQGQLDFTDLENQTWATTFTMNKGEVNDTSSSTGENNEDYTRHIHGNNGKSYNIELLEKAKKNILNIDMLIINDLEELFMQIF